MAEKTKKELQEELEASNKIVESMKERMRLEGISLDSTKERSNDWNENFYIQGTAYAEMFYERTGIEIKQIVILVVTEDGTVQEFIKEKEPYLNYLSEAITEWGNQ